MEIFVIILVSVIFALITNYGINYLLDKKVPYNCKYFSSLDGERECIAKYDADILAIKRKILLTKLFFVGVLFGNMFVLSEHYRYGLILSASVLATLAMYNYDHPDDINV